jgi:hypothetical protein
VLYELEPGRRLGWEIEQLADELAAVFGRLVDLVSPAALHRRLKDTVPSEARTLYAARAPPAREDDRRRRTAHLLAADQTPESLAADRQLSIGEPESFDLREPQLVSP